jgi:hypothetical protein
MTREPDRKLSGNEIELVVHLHKAGAATMPVRVLASAVRTAMTLRKLGLVSAWSRYTDGRGSEGPFFSLTRAGAYRAESLHLAREAGRRPSTIRSSRPVQRAYQGKLFNPGDDNDRS